MRILRLGDDGTTVLIYQDGKLVDEEPIECHPHLMTPAPSPPDPTPCPCGIARVDCEYHRA